MTLQAALDARNQGDYSIATLALFEQAWQETQTLETYAALLSFQRDLGQPLTKKQYEHLQTHYLTKGKGPGRFAGKLKRSLQNLCLEYEHNHPGTPPCPITSKQTAAGVVPLPWQRNAVAKLRQRQTEWRTAWLEDLNNKAHKGIAVVGNSGRLLGQAKGSLIDSHGAVIRFNQPATSHDAHLHLGVHTHTRVVAPGYKGVIPPCNWVVLSGPEMQYQRQNWRHLAPVFKRETPIVTVPLELWASLVEQLEAPPSAGLLMLAWLRRQPGLSNAIHPYGFGYSPSEPVPYHAADPNHPPAIRHRWGKEAELIATWFTK